MPAEAITPGTKPVSQRDAVRFALLALGDKAANADLVAYVKQHYTHDVSKFISQYKNSARKFDQRAGSPVAAPVAAPAPARRGRGRPKGSKAKPKPVASPAAVAPPRPRPVGGLAEDLSSLALLQTKYGTAQVRGMLDVLETVAAR